MVAAVADWRPAEEAAAAAHALLKQLIADVNQSIYCAAESQPVTAASLARMESLN